MKHMENLAKKLLVSYPKLKGMVSYYERFKGALVKESFHSFTDAEEIIGRVIDVQVHRARVEFCRSVVKGILTGMSRELGRVLWLHYCKGMSLGDISMKLNIARTSVFRRVNRALKIFTEQIATFEIFREQDLVLDILKCVVV